MRKTTEKGFSFVTECAKEPHRMKDKGSPLFTGGVARIYNGDLFHVRVKV